MAFTLIAHTGAQSADGTSATTPGINTTGAALITAAIASIHGQTAPMSDSNGNTWTALTPRDNPSSPTLTIYYVVNPSVGAGHTFSANAGGGSSRFPSITVTAWSGQAGSPFDVENGGFSSGTSQDTGNTMPTATNSLLVAAAGHSEVFASSIDSGFTISDDENGASSLAFGNVMAYLVETSVVAQDPNFSGDGSTHGWAAAIAVFKSADGVVPSIGAAASPFYRIKGWKYYSYARGV